MARINTHYFQNVVTPGKMNHQVKIKIEWLQKRATQNESENSQLECRNKTLNPSLANLTKYNKLIEFFDLVVTDKLLNNILMEKIV